MKNVLFLDNNFTPVLLVNEEQVGNTITLVIDADDTADQELAVTLGTITETYTITPSEENEILLQPDQWNYGDVTVLVLNKGEEASDPIYLSFPEAIDTDASLYKTSEAHYSMQGGQSLQQQIINIQTEIGDLFSQVIDYILPSAVSQSSIEDGSNNTALEFEFYNNVADETVSFYTCFQFEIETTVDSQTETYGDCTLTATLAKDGVTVVTDVNTYGDGKKTLMLNYLLENMTKGNHTFTLNLALTGGALSQLQFMSAYIMAMASIDDGNYDEGYGVYEDLAFDEYMEEGDQSILGDYIDLDAPTGGSSAGNFDGSKFCSDWFAAFVRPIEYMTIYGSRFGFSTAYPDPNDPSAWEHFTTNQGGETQLIPEFLDDLVFDNTGKHINMWFAAISLDPWSGKALGLTGVYIPRNVGFRLSGNYPTQGYGVFQLIDHVGDVYIPAFTQYNWNFMSKSYNGADFPENPAYIGANRKTNFILVYNVTAFKAYLNTIDRETFRAFDNTLFALAECNIDKSKRPRTGT